MIITNKNNYRKCLFFNECSTEETKITKKWRLLWYRYNDCYICNRHYDILVRDKEKRKKQFENYSKRIINFLGKRIMLSFDIRKGICERCGKKDGDKFINGKGKISKVLTHIHHYFYIPIMVWCCTIELCNSCHSLEKFGLTQNKFLTEINQYIQLKNKYPRISLP